MEILNIGPLEFIAILVLMFIFLGPEGMVKTARQIGSWIRKIIRSPIWAEIMGYSKEIRELPTKIVRESGLEDDLKEIRQVAKDATGEASLSIQEANQQIQNSLQETGSVSIIMGNNQAATTGAVPMDGSGSTPSTVQTQKPKIVID